MPIVRYLLALMPLAVGYIAAQQLVTGHGLEDATWASGFLGVSFVFTSVVLLPPFLVFLWLLPRTSSWTRSIPGPVAAAVLGFLVWVTSALAFEGVSVAVVNLVHVIPAPGQSSATITDNILSILLAGAVGAYLGLIEGIARWRSRRANAAARSD